MPQKVNARLRSAKARKPRSDSARAARSYTVIYQRIPADEGKGFYAHIPALGITTNGDTLGEAKEMARDAIEGYVEVSREIGQPVPQEAATERVEVMV